MIQEDRLTKILALLETKPTLSVNEIMETLFVSAATVRRDLAELAKRGLIVRSFGGAVALTNPGRSVRQHSGALAAHSTPIGIAAAELVPDRSTVFLGGSPAARSMLASLAGKDSLTVVTDSLSIAESISGSASRVYCTGGAYNRSLDIFTGKQAAELVSHFRYDYAFLYFDGITENGQILDYCMEKLPVLNILKRNAKQLVLLAPKAVIGHEAANVLFDISSVDIVVSDTPEFFENIFRGSLISV